MFVFLPTQGLPRDGVFSVSSKFNSNASSTEESDAGHQSTLTGTKPSSSSATLIAREVSVNCKNTIVADI